jgi:hypothetical protein
MSEEDIAELITEIWKITNVLHSSKELENSVPLNFSIRKIKKMINKNQLELLDLTGQKYDEGISVDVIDKEEGNEKGYLYISKMIEPIILFKGKVIKYGKVMLRG